eukprot:229852-Rhodomonas_salina.1
MSDVAYPSSSRSSHAPVERSVLSVCARALRWAELALRTDDAVLNIVDDLLRVMLAPARLWEQHSCQGRTPQR